MTLLFQQPGNKPGIAGNLFVPLANKVQPAADEFALILWQRNPFTSNGLLVPNEFDASARTGFASGPMAGMQVGFHNTPRSSVAQMYGGTVGVYLNSADLPGTPTSQKMMITPQYTFSAPPSPFTTSESVLNAEMDLQVPTCVGKDTYIVADHLYEGPAGAQISFGVKLFGDANPLLGTGYDIDSGSYMINPPLGDEAYVTATAESAPYQSAVFTGWKHFQWTVARAQFVAALQLLGKTFPGHFPSTDPSQYTLTRIHLNAEFHFNPLPAELGWSMCKWRVWLG